MAKILEVKNFMGEGWEITIKGKPQEELIAIKEVINCFEDKEKELEKIKKGYCQESFNANREAMGLPPIKKPQETPEKPKGMLYVLNSNSMLDIAKQIINAVEFTVDIPKGLAAITFDRKHETKNRLLELIEYLRVYADWRE